MHRERKPSSPGEILLEEFLKPLKITQKVLADHLGCDYKVVNRIINERASITPNIAKGLAMAFETTPDFWLNAQTAMDIWELNKSQRKKIKSLIPHQKAA